MIDILKIYFFGMDLRTTNKHTRNNLARRQVNFDAYDDLTKEKYLRRQGKTVKHMSEKVGFSTFSP